MHHHFVSVTPHDDHLLAAVIVMIIGIRPSTIRHRSCASAFGIQCVHLDTLARKYILVSGRLSVISDVVVGDKVEE